MRRLALIAALLVSCTPTVTTPRYWSCDEDSTCDPGATCTPLRGASYCTTECGSTADCLAYGYPAVCSDGHCWGECWPMEPDAVEDIAFCRKYGFLCPSDCAAQGLICDSVTGYPLPRYGCVSH